MPANDFPVGGPREAVYRFLERHGWNMSNWSDKVWLKGDLMLNVYAAGSRAIIHKATATVADDKLRALE